MTRMRTSRDAPRLAGGGAFCGVRDRSRRTARRVTFAAMSGPQLTELHVADPPERWEALGFTVNDGQLALGGLRLTLGGPGQGITRWAIHGIPPTNAIDGLPTTPAPPPPQLSFPTTHPNGATGIDHVVVLTPDFDQTAAALEAAGMPLRREAERNDRRHGFRRLGPAILELVEVPDGAPRFWGLVVVVEDLDALAERLGERLGPIRPAVQPGRRIATLRADAGLEEAVAFMDPET
jgi:hypothetical protein